MSASLKMIDFQKAQHAINKALSNLVEDRYVTVGIHESAERPQGANMTMAELGALQNFGSEDGKIPAREWLVPGVESGNEVYIDAIAEGIRDGSTPEQILDVVGNEAVGHVQQFIRDLKEPKNADSTIRAKGSDNPLIEFGNMSRSVTFAQAKIKPQEGL